MSLNTGPLASTINAAYLPMISTGLILRQAFANAWSSGYTTYAAGGSCPISSVGNNGSIIGSAIMTFDGFDIGNVAKLAQAFADFWEGSHLVPSGPAAVTIGNDASSKVGLFESAILSSRTDQLKTPPFKHLFDAVEPIIKSIIWTGANSQGSTVTGTIS